MSISRWNVPIAPGLAVALALALAGAAAAQAPDPTPRLKVGDQWNHGDDPWDAHPGNYKFNPDRVGIIHLKLLDGFRIEATRFHYMIEDVAGGWNKNNEDIAVEVINWLNGPRRAEDRPVDPICIKGGLRQLVFGHPHHVVVYVQNKNVEYPSRPIWFGNSLQGTVKDGNGEYQTGKARENHSFFRTEVRTPTGITGDVSTKIIYFQNHFHKHGLLTGHDPIPKGEFRVYSMKISLLSQVIGDDEGEYNSPIIIDPDTGNMGGGSPFLCE